MMVSPIRTRIDKRKVVAVRGTRRQEIEYKPNGFWYSVHGDWERWCESEQQDWLDARYVHQVALGGEKMLYVRTVAEIDAFHRKYKAKLIPQLKADWIDWGAVAKDFDGIEIAPYQWDRRHSQMTRWYYSWDCASGCIWRPRGVKLELIGEFQKTPTDLDR